MKAICGASINCTFAPFMNLLLNADVMYEIFLAAWLSFSPERPEEWAKRYTFYRDIRNLSKTWKTFINKIVLRQLTFASDTDITFYRRAILDRLGVDPVSKVERGHAHAYRFFQNIPLRLVLVRHRQLRPFEWDVDLARIPLYVPACREIAVEILADPFSDENDNVAHYSILRFLSQYRLTLSAVRFSWPSIKYVAPSLISPPKTRRFLRMESVTYLRLDNLPRCAWAATGHPARPRRALVESQVSKRRQESPPPWKQHTDDCLSCYLPSLFPNLRHLHLGARYPLKSLSLPQTVTLITLEVPVKPDRVRGSRSTFAGWNIVPAVDDGPLTGWKGRIVVKTGSRLPQLWQGVNSACRLNGIEVVYRDVYPAHDAKPG